MVTAALSSMPSPRKALLAAAGTAAVAAVLCGGVIGALKMAEKRNWQQAAQIARCTSALDTAGKFELVAYSNEDVFAYPKGKLQTGSAPLIRLEFRDTAVVYSDKTAAEAADIMAGCARRNGLPKTGARFVEAQL